jgi:FixJ family two-component response regulator
VAGAIFILDDDADVLESLADLARTFSGRQCITARSVDGMIALGCELDGCEIAILDINLGAGRPSGIDAYNWLRAAKFRGRIFFLTGHARNHPLVEEARRLGNVVIIEKPAGIGILERAFSAA